jgi:hypothetical protein
VLLARRQGLHGVALHVSKSFAPRAAGVAHPAFDYENRIVFGGCRRPDRRVDLRPQRPARTFPGKMKFLEAMDAYAASFEASGRRWR